MLSGARLPADVQGVVVVVALRAVKPAEASSGGVQITAVEVVAVARVAVSDPHVITELLDAVNSFVGVWGHVLQSNKHILIFRLYKILTLIALN